MDHYAAMFSPPRCCLTICCRLRPCTYLDVTVSRKKPASVRVIFAISSDLVKFTDGPVNGDVQQTEKFCYGIMGKAFQTPLAHSGDHTTIVERTRYRSPGKARFVFRKPC